MAKKAKVKKEFGSILSKTLDEKGISQSAFSASLGITRSYANQVLHGSKVPSGKWVDLVAETMRLSPIETTQLHYAAAKDRGYKLPPLDLLTPVEKKKKK